jgi:hypothetical protein
MYSLFSAKHDAPGKKEGDQVPRWSYIRVRMDHTVVVGIYKGASTEPCNYQDEQYGVISKYIFSQYPCN